MKLIDNEVRILVSDDKTIVLTSKRIRQENKQWGKLQIKSIMLEHVTSCEYDRKSNPIFLVVGFVFIAFAAASSFSGGHDWEEIALLAGCMGLLFIIFFWMTIRKALIVSSPTTKILMNTNGMEDESIKTFIDKLEEAKADSYGR